MSLKKNNLYKPQDDFIYMAMKNFSWGAAGLILGVIINNTVIYLSNKLKIKTLFLQNIIQLLLCSILLSSLNIYYNYFGWTWQNATPGLFFVSFFFGVQYKLLTNIQTTYILEDEK